MITGKGVSQGNVEDTARKAFARARRKALLRRIWARARRDPGSVMLASFDHCKAELSAAVVQVPVGVRTVSLSDIVGSVSRSRDFDDRFLPLNRGLEDRWCTMYRFFQLRESLGMGIPPVSLYMIGEVYFVKDGNHRISVARVRGRSSIEAEIILLNPLVSR